MTWVSTFEVPDPLCIFLQLDMNNHLIGPEIVSLAEMDVPPEDLVFHKFYMNKMSSSKKPKTKKKKKQAEDEAADDILGIDGEDDSDNEEIDDILDSSNPSAVADGDYDYDDLDQVAGEDDDDDLVGYVSDEAEGDIHEVNSFNDVEDDVDIGDMDDSDVEIGDADDGSDEEEEEEDPAQRKRKRKSSKAGASPFASAEDYEHLLNEDVGIEDSPTTNGESSVERKKKPKSKNKSKKSKKN